MINFGVGNSAYHFTEDESIAFFIIESDPAQFAKDANIFFKLFTQNQILRLI